MRQAARSHHVHHLLPLRLPKREFEVTQLEVPVADPLLQDDRHQVCEAATDELLGRRGAFAERRAHVDLDQPRIEALGWRR